MKLKANQAKAPPAHEVRAIAVAAMCDPRSVVKYFTQPSRLKPVVAERIRRALAEAPK